MRKLLAATMAGALALAGASSAPAARPGQIAELGLGASAKVYVFGLATGSDGNLWFADLGCSGIGSCALGQITASGRIRLFTRGLNPGSVPFQVVLGRDGDIWFTDQGTRPAIGRISPQGRIAEFSRGLRQGSQPFAITMGPGHDLWFTDQGPRPAVGRVTTHGQITEFSRGLGRRSVPFGIAAGRGGRLWFTDRGCSGSGRCALGTVSARGTIHERTAGLRSGSQPLGIAAGFAGRLWFADASGALGQVSAGGRISEHGLPRGSSPVAVGAGPDGAAWFTDEGTTPGIGRIAASGAIQEFRAGLAGGSEPAQIVPAPDGDMWFTDEGGTAAIGRVSTGAPPALASAPAVTGSPRVGAKLRCLGARWAPWSGLAPSTSRLGFDGYGWLRDRAPVLGQGGPEYRVTGADRGRRIACRATATYPTPLQTTAVAVSRTVTVGG
ncbi:MAG: virginiamycin B lyase family protein [Solirubrobacteraceae bacterium]